MDKTTTSLGYWVRRQRRALDLTQRVLADCVGCSVATIKKIEADERRPSVVMAERLALCLQISEDQRGLFLEVAHRERAVDALPLASAAVPAPAALTITPLPVSTTRFVGRAGELRLIEERLLGGDCRLLTVVGLGGVGKTRLALEAAAVLAHSYADGVSFVPLADTDSAAGVAAALLRQLGLSVVGSIDVTTQLANALRRRHLLLVLDNLEHLLREPETIDLLSGLLAAAPRMALLVTSRERLSLQEEWVLPLQGLPLDQPAIALFADRARRVGQEVAPEAQAAVAKICQLVEGLPLAVELAAGWTRLMTPDQIVEQLEAGSTVLSTRLRNIPDRHRSLKALLDQSWTLLTATEQHSFMRLAVFRGGFDGAAAAAVAGADLPVLLGLVDKSLVRADRSGRYDLHALARHYAALRLELAGATADVCERHADYYFALVQHAADQEQGPRRIRWQDRIEVEYANIRAAWQWALGVGRSTALWPVVRPLFDFWTRRGYWDDGRDLLHLAVQRAPPDDSSEYAQALVALMTLLGRTGRLAEARSYGEEGYRRAMMTGDPATIGMAEMQMGMLVTEVLARERHFQAAIAACRQTNNRLLLANAFLLYGDFLRQQGALEPARALYTEMLTLARALDDELAVYALGNLGRLALLDGDIDRANTCFAECVAMARAQGAPIALADWLLRLGVVQYYQQEPTAAHAALAECVGLAEELNHWSCLSNARVWLAAATLSVGDVAEADRLLHMSLAGYVNRLQGPEQAHSAAAELAEALVAAAHIRAAQNRFDEAALALGCAETIHMRAQAPSDPFLEQIADQVRRCLTDEMDPSALNTALARGRAMSALEGFRSQIS
jgi:predicted ATPase/transcriptional regulator with XRE-family HTH domain